MKPNDTPKLSPQRPYPVIAARVGREYQSNSCAVGSRRVCVRDGSLNVKSTGSSCALA